MDNTEQKVRASSIRLSTVATTTRQTPKTDFGTVMRDGLIRAGNVAIDGLKVAAPFVPGSSIVSAALAGANVAANGGSPSYGVSEAGTSNGFGSGYAGLSSHTSALSGGGPTANGAVSNGSSTLAVPGRRPTVGTDVTSGAGSPTSGQTPGASDTFNQMMSATRQMAEFQASFNLQYLQLQEKIQIDTRQFNLVSNIMKTKHDAAKNALNNVR